MGLSQAPFTTDFAPATNMLAQPGFLRPVTDALRDAQHCAEDRHGFAPPDRDNLQLSKSLQLRRRGSRQAFRRGSPSITVLRLSPLPAHESRSDQSQKSALTDKPHPPLPSLFLLHLPT